MRQARGTYLKAADESVGDVVLEERPTLVIFAAPSPNILTFSIGPALIQNSSSDTPHDDTEDKEKNSESSIIDGDLFSSVVASSVVTPEDYQTHEERDTGDDKKRDLRPGAGTSCPRRQAVSSRDVFCCVEDGEGSGEHSKNDQRAAEVDST